MGVNYRADREGAERVVGEIEAVGRQGVAIQADVSDPDAVEAAFATVENAFGPVLVLVNNAGTGTAGLLADADLDEWRRVIDVNLTSTYLTIRRALLPMMRARFGRIVNIISASAARAIPDSPATRRARRA